jgi:hypothetical protein
MLSSPNVNTNVNNNVASNVGNNVGANVGNNVNVGANVGNNVGANVGANVGNTVNVGANVGNNVGANVGNNVGANVTARSFYATPVELAYRPWALDFLFDEAGNPQFPSQAFSWPTTGQPHWRYDDWDPMLRFWALPFDPFLTDWRTAHGSVDTQAIVVGREFGRHYEDWLFLDGSGKALVQKNWLSESVLQWNAQFVSDATAHKFVQRELSILAEQMQDDRNLYLGEALGQADGIADYYHGFLGINPDQHRWTKELIQCAIGIGNISYSAYKADFKRVRPTYHAPGLVAPFGPPRTPAFPSGHSFVAQTIALLLLEIPGIAERFGDKPKYGGPIVKKGAKVTDNSSPEQFAQHPLLWLANRIGRNRERIGVHYPSDTDGGRQLAWGIRTMLFHDGKASQSILPSLAFVLKKARGEWN